MSNCNYKMLSSNKIGNILYCEDCDEMMIGIGTFILKFKEEQSKIFLKALKSTAQEYNKKRNYECDKVFLKTPVNNLMIALNMKELTQSIELLDLAFLKIEIDKLIIVKA